MRICYFLFCRPSTCIIRRKIAEIPVFSARIMQAPHTFRREIWFAYNTFPREFSAHALCALFSSSEKRFCAFFRRYTPQTEKIKK